MQTTAIDAPVAAAIGRTAQERWRTSRWLTWMANPLYYAVGTPILTAFGLLTSLVIPRFLAPQAFGSYVLLLDVCRNAMRADLGLSQLADRRIAAGLDNARKDEAERILAARWRLGLVALALVTPLACGVAALSHRLSPLDAGLATAAGIVAMIAGGPSSIYRARGDVWMYTALTFVFGIGFFIPRLVGVILGGTTGCFALLLCWYAAVVAVFWRSFRRVPRCDVATSAMIRAAMPMFVFAASWTLYLSAARWVAAILMTPSEFGFFALGANLVFTGVTTVGTLADVRYPRWLERLSQISERELSGAVVREAAVVALSLGLAVAILIPATPRLFALLFPGYHGAERTLIALAFSGIPLGVFAWFLPIMIARSAAPASDAALVFGPAGALLVAAMVAGERMLGLEGLAWGLCLSAIVALAGMALILERGHILTPSAAIVFAFSAPLGLTFPAATIIATHQLVAASPATPRTVQLKDRLANPDRNS